MRNKYPGTCYRCGKPVAAGEGHFEMMRYFNPKHPTQYPNAPKWYPDAPRWRTQHASCAISARQAGEIEAHASQGGEKGKGGE